VPERVTARRGRPPIVSDQAPDFVKKVTAVMMAAKGDLLPVSAFPVDGTWPVGTQVGEATRAQDPSGTRLASVTVRSRRPHAAIRAKSTSRAPGARRDLQGGRSRARSWHYTIQVAPEDCTGCNLCVEICPAKDKSNPRHKAINMEDQLPLREPERENYEFFLGLPEPDRTRIKLDNKGSQFLEPLFEYSGACAGCGETPYVKLLSQLFGDRALIANATGCSSIYGGNLPTTPYCTNREGRGPAWANSLFEDNAEFFVRPEAVDRQAHRPGPARADRARGQGGRHPGAGDPRRRPGRRVRRREAACAGRRAAQETRHSQEPRSAAPRVPRRLSGEEERVGGGRRRLGVRYRLRRARPRHGPGRDVNLLVLDTGSTEHRYRVETRRWRRREFAMAGKDVRRTSACWR
jgi:ferredoxin